MGFISGIGRRTCRRQFDGSRHPLEYKSPAVRWGFCVRWVLSRESGGEPAEGSSTDPVTRSNTKALPLGGAFVFDGFYLGNREENLPKAVRRIPSPAHANEPPFWGGSIALWDHTSPAHANEPPLVGRLVQNAELTCVRGCGVLRESDLCSASEMSRPAYRH